MTRRILYVQRPPGGGSATALVELVRGLDRGRFQPLVLFHEESRYAEPLRELGAEVLVLNGRRPRVRGIARVIRRRGADLVHHNNNPGANRASILAARLAGVPQVCHVRFFRRYAPLVDRRLAAGVDAFIYASRAVERHCRSAIGMPTGRGRVIYESFGFGALEASREEARRVRDELGLADGERIISNVGRLVRWKGQEDFLRAVASLGHPGVVALVVGEPGPGPAGRGYGRRLETLARELGLGGRAIFTGFRADVPAILAASEVVVHSASRPEPFGRVVVEAMAAGRPVVATAAGGVREIVDPGRTGLLVPPGDPGRMAAALDRLLRDPEEARRLGGRAREEVRRRFSTERCSRAIQDVYETALARSG